MVEEKKEASSKRFKAFEEAIKNIELFTAQNQSSSTLQVERLELTSSGAIIPHKLSNIELIFRLFFSFFSYSQEHKQRKLKVEQKILESITYLKSHWKVIEKLKEGNEDERNLAQLAAKAINRYNSLIKKVRTPPLSLIDRVFKTLYETSALAVGEDLKTEIDVPKDYSIYLRTSKKEGVDVTMHKIASFLQEHGMLSSVPTAQEIDFFYMKTITLANRSDLPLDLRKQVIGLMRETPITSLIENRNEIESPDSHTSFISLKQTLAPFPGEQITIEGSFKRDALSSVASVPLPETFHVTTQAVQTGYPHPSQHMGWALSKALIPEMPIRKTLLPLFFPLFDEMQALAKKLLPEGSLNRTAKHLLLLKKEAFLDHQATFLALHRHLNHALVERSPYISTIKTTEAIENYFAGLSDSPAPYERLSKGYDHLNQIFIDIPYKTILKKWEEDESVFSGEPKERLHTIHSLYDKEINKAEGLLRRELIKSSTKVEKQAIIWAQLLGPHLGYAGKAIVLQYLSEKIGYPPPLMNDFESLIQTSAYRQLIAFIQGIEEAHKQTISVETIAAQMEKALKQEIRSFEGKDEDEPEEAAKNIVKELEVYFNIAFFGK